MGVLTLIGELFTFASFQGGIPPFFLNFKFFVII